MGSPVPCLVVSPIGDLPPWIPGLLAEKLPDIFGFPVDVIPLLDNIAFAFDPERTQYYSTRVLARLETACPDHGLKVLGVTKEDLFIPILTHVYGEAQLGGRASVVSITRLLRQMPREQTGRHRVVKEAVHELGHSFDLRHCQDPFCVMYYCRRIEDVDQKSPQFCRYCRVLLNDQVQAGGGPVRPGPQS